jgi:hypothetical protein
MRHLVCLALIACCLVAASGCVQATKDIQVANRSVVRGLTQDRTMTESYTEHLHRINAVVDQDARALVDDWDMFWQRERQSRLTRWHTP